jgi:outer membrane protein OmpA-like peptidoglycan-associated protein
MIDRRRLLLASVAAPLAAALAPAARADAVVDLAGRSPQAADIVRALRQQRALRPAAPGMHALARTRSLNVAATPATSSKAVSFDQVVFEFNSARLRAESRRTLAQIGQALASPELAAMSFQVEGHTDAVGGFAYNIRLSRQRAASVCAYLREQHGIAAGRLVAVGKGPTELLEPDRPDSPANRRVALVAFQGGPARTG